MPDLSYPGSMKSICCPIHSDIFFENDHVSLMHFVAIHSCWSIHDLCHWSILIQWNPVISFCYCSDSLFMDCKCKIVDLLTGSRPLIVGMNHNFSWDMFYTKFPSIPVWRCSSPNIIILGYEKLSIAHIFQLQSLLILSWSTQHSWSTFSFFLFSCFSEGIVILFVCDTGRTQECIQSLNVYCIVDGSFYWNIHSGIKNVEWSFIIHI